MVESLFLAALLAVTQEEVEVPSEDSSGFVSLLDYQFAQVNRVDGPAASPGWRS